METFNLDNYFIKISEKNYSHDLKFLNERKKLAEELFQEIQFKLDKEGFNEETFNIELSYYDYDLIHKEAFLESIPLSFVYDRMKKAYIITIVLKDLKNIENFYNQIMQEQILPKEEYIKEQKELLFFKYNNPI